ncbi:unnamed protein product [Caenorhabditis brenneri]
MSTLQQKVIENLHNEVEALRNELAVMKKNQKESVKNEEKNGRKRKGDEDGESSSAKKPAPEPENFFSKMSKTADSRTANSDQLNIKARKFVLKHVFKNVSTMAENIKYKSSTEEYYSVLWHFCIERTKDFFAVYLYCDRQKNKEWSIDTEFEICFLHPNGNSIRRTRPYRFKETSGVKFNNFIAWQEMEKAYLDNDELTVEIRVQITKVEGVYGENLRNFDDEECSDVTLVVNDRKFHVAKLYLSSHSPYFKTMFLGGFEESKKSEIELSGVDADDLQKYLEALYGEDVIDEMTVEGILRLADMYDTKILAQKCAKFLQESSKKTLQKKLEMAVKYNLHDLKNKYLSEIKTIADVRSVVPGCISQMDSSLTAILLEKVLALV